MTKSPYSMRVKKNSWIVNESYIVKYLFLIVSAHVWKKLNCEHLELRNSSPNFHCKAKGVVILSSCQGVKVSTYIAHNRVKYFLKEHTVWFFFLEFFSPVNSFCIKNSFTISMLLTIAADIFEENIYFTVHKFLQNNTFLKLNKDLAKTIIFLKKSLHLPQGAKQVTAD